MPSVRLAARLKFREETPRNQPGYSWNCQTFAAAPAEPGDLPWLLDAKRMPYQLQLFEFIEEQLEPIR
jgi:hypothetical protein